MSSGLKLFMCSFAALLLHPDKNRHPKAGVAFKLVSEVTTCDIDGMKPSGSSEKWDFDNSSAGI